MQTEVDIEARKAAGRQAAIDSGATDPKPVGATSPDNYPYTYWYVIGYNEQVESK